MKALDTNVLLRFLLDDDRAQSSRVKELFEKAEREGGRFRVTWPVVLETIWVLTAVYEFRRTEALRALELLSQMPILEFEDHDGLLQLVRLGRSTRTDLPDLLIGRSAQSAGSEATLTFEKGLAKTGLFEQLV